VFTQARAISETRDRLGIIGFGDTYYDLVKDLRSPHTFLDLEDELKPVLRALDNLYRGTIIQPNGEFVLRRDEGDFEMSVVAEGIKKVGALVELIRSRRIQLGTSLFFDEIEANLHPQLLYDVLDQLVQFVVAANESSQVFIATHSYFVLKSLELLAREHEIHVPICVLQRTADGRVEAEFSSLEEGMPKNSIVDASVELFNRNLELQARGA
jgi:AAA15 family ATPase/GTPase